MTHPGEQFYPQGVHWDDPIARGTLPDLLSRAAAEFGTRPVIEFRDRQISYAEASVYDAGGELIAHGTSTLMALPGKGLKLGVAKFLTE